jgi:hypothetical protein
MKTIKIWYMRPDWFRNGIMGDKPDPANLAATHIELMTISATDDETDVLNRVYRSCQGEVWSPHGEARELIESKGLEHTSMSVGDVIVVDGEAHMIASVGFDNLGRIE